MIDETRSLKFGVMLTKEDYNIRSDMNRFVNENMIKRDIIKKDLTLFYKSFLIVNSIFLISI